MSLGILVLDWDTPRQQKFHPVWVAALGLERCLVFLSGPAANLKPALAQARPDLHLKSLHSKWPGAQPGHHGRSQIGQPSLNFGVRTDG